MKSLDVKSRKYIDFDKKNNKEDPKFKVGDHIRISRYNNIFAKVNVANLSEEVFVITKVKITVPWTYIISGLKGELIVGMLFNKELQKKTKNKSKII